jgi:hypothetical protein
MSKFATATIGSGPDRSALKTIITGQSGVGKTWFTSTIESDGSPIFMIPVEEGLKGLCPDANPQRFRDERDRDIVPANLAELMQALDAFVAKNQPQGPEGQRRRPFRHLGIDSLSGIEKMVHAAACGAERARHMEDKEFKKVWSAALPLWQNVQNKLDEVRRTGVNIWLIAHSVEDYDSSDTTGDVFRRWDLMLRGTSKTLAETRELWRQWADNVFFIQKDVKVQKGDKNRRAMASLGGRILITRDTGRVYAKSRLPIPATLPATWPDLQRAIRAGAPVKVDATREQIAALLSSLDPEDKASAEADLAKATNATQLSSLLSRVQAMASIAARERGQDDGDGTSEDEKAAQAIDRGEA